MHCICTLLCTVFVPFIHFIYLSWTSFFISRYHLLYCHLIRCTYSLSSTLRIYIFYSFFVIHPIYTLSTSFKKKIKNFIHLYPLYPYLISPCRAEQWRFFLLCCYFCTDLNPSHITLVRTGTTAWLHWRSICRIRRGGRVWWGVLIGRESIFYDYQLGKMRI